MKRKEHLTFFVGASCAAYVSITFVIYKIVLNFNVEENFLYPFFNNIRSILPYQFDTPLLFAIAILYFSYLTWGFYLISVFVYKNLTRYLGIIYFLVIFSLLMIYFFPKVYSGLVTRCF